MLYHLLRDQMPGFDRYLLFPGLHVSDHARDACITSGSTTLFAYDIAGDALLIRAFELLPRRHDLPSIWHYGATLASYQNSI